MTATYFITGTDTDAGKTYVSGQLIQYFRAQGKSVLAIKPLASGCIWLDGVLESEDQLHLNRYQGAAPDLGLAYRFEPPIAPHIAAWRQGTVITAASLHAICQPFEQQGYDVLLIEGAGGLLVPLNPEESWLDFLRLSGYQSILVVGLRLGCINQALLTDYCLRQEALPRKGWIANTLDPMMLELEANIACLEQGLLMPRLGKLAYGGSLEIETDLWNV